jgi:lactate dehydrogenase-like 2-hydroxyacid dehydrogenase
MGAIGRSIARQLAGFRTAIAYADPSPVSAGEGIGAVRMELPALLQRSDSWS